MREPPPNNGLHATADTTAVKLLDGVGRRAMPGVGLTYAERKD
jgi:hypothetical protein